LRSRQQDTTRQHGANEGAQRARGHCGSHRGVLL
jgi:hypothetical protein